MRKFENVVRVYCTSQAPDYDCPWQASAPEHGTGSGVMVGKDLVLTGAHVVANATFLQVQKVGQPDKTVATVKAVSHDMDLALLQVQDRSFGKNIVPAKIGPLPHLRDKVSVVGFPIGGEEVSITEGVVSRIEVQTYAHSQRRLMAATVDAAINAGNSGGPVFKGDKVVGIAFQKLGGDVDNIGEMVPSSLIRHFLQQAKVQTRIEVPGLGLWAQTLENPTLRKKLGLSPDQSGVLVSAVEHGGSADKILRPRDVVMRVGEFDIANNATAVFRRRYRTHFSAVVGEYAVGDQVDVTFVRRKKVKTVAMTLQPAVDLVPRSIYDVPPSFLVWGGFVFQPLSRDFLSTWEDWLERAPTSFLYAYKTGLRTPGRREIVVLSRVLADQSTVGYQDLECVAIDAVNGKPVRDLAHLAQVLDGARGLVEFSTSARAVIVVDAREVRAGHAALLGKYRIGQDRSIDIAEASAPPKRKKASAE